MCKNQELTVSWEVSVCDCRTTACCDGFHFSGSNQKGLWKNWARKATWWPSKRRPEKHCAWVLCSVFYYVVRLTKINTLMSWKGLLQKRTEDVTIYYKLTQTKSEDRQWARSYFVSRKARSSTAKSCPCSLWRGIQSRCFKSILFNAVYF